MRIGGFGGAVIKELGAVPTSAACAIIERLSERQPFRGAARQAYESA